MARKPRIEFEGALYHVISRGNRQEEIFLDDEDFQKYISLLGKYKERYNFKLYAFSLMSNHIHLLLEVSNNPLSKIKQGLQQSYTQYFNKRYQKVGHLFQGRYKAILCQKDVYLLELVRYIHSNPIRAKIVFNLLDYKWTSHRLYIYKEKENLVDTEFILRQFSRKKEMAREMYEEFIEEGKGLGYQGKFYDTIEQRILGDEEFVEDILSRGREEEEEKGKISKKLSLDKILEVICEGKKATPIMIRNKIKERETVLLRRIFIYLARYYFRYTSKAIASYLGIDSSAISKNIKVILERVKSNFWEGEIKKMKRKLEMS